MITSLTCALCGDEEITIIDEHQRALCHDCAGGTARYMRKTVTDIPYRQMVEVHTPGRTTGLRKWYFDDMRRAVLWAMSMGKASNSLAYLAKGILHGGKFYPIT